MTVLRASNAPVGLNRGKPVRAANPLQRTAWTRPSDWVTFHLAHSLLAVTVKPLSL